MSATPGDSTNAADADADVSPLVLTAGWIAFAAFITAAAAVDVLLISRSTSSSPRGMVCCRGSAIPVYAKQILFWLAAGMVFMLIVGWLMGLAASGSWLYGYFLEYTLSIDNLFVFQLIFKAYSTPELQVERALFWGISAAVVLRLAFFAVGTKVLEMGILARIFFGLVLVYSGVKTILESDDGDEDDPSQNVLVRFIAKLLPLHDSYSDEPNFFVLVPPGPPQEVEAASAERPEAVVVGSPGPDVELRSMLDGVGDADSVASSPAALKETSRVLVLKVTPLFLVVISLGLIDVVFAVDSVTAKISSVVGFSADVSFFLNLSSSAFAMFVLRSLYLVVDMLTHMFRFLKYGVGAVLALIGVKLMLSGYVEIGMLASSLLILGLLLLSILASAVLPVPPVEKRDSEAWHEDPADGPDGEDVGAQSQACDGRVAFTIGDDD